MCDEHWTKIHPGRAFAGAPALALEPKLPADLALAGLRVLAEAGFLHAKLDGGPELDLTPSSAGPVDVIEVTAPKDGGESLRRLMTSPLVAARHGKLSFDWRAVSCATDGIFGHAR